MASVWISSLAENYESKTCSLCNCNEPFHKPRGVKSQKATIQGFTVVENLHGTTREEEVDCPECVLLFVFLQILIFKYFFFKSSVLNIVHLGRILRKIGSMEMP